MLMELQPSQFDIKVWEQVAVIEANGDFLGKAARTGPYYTGHLTREHYILFGFDLAF